MISVALSCDVEHCEEIVVCEVSELTIQWPEDWQGWPPDSIVAHRTGVVHRCPRHAMSMLDIVAFL